MYIQMYNDSMYLMNALGSILKRIITWMERMGEYMTCTSTTAG